MSATKVYHRSSRTCATSRDDWETPPELFALLDEEFHFQWDVCADGSNAKCSGLYFNARENGLVQDWRKCVCWMNPPFSQTTEWVTKALAEASRGALVVCLLAARPSNLLWHNVIFPKASEIRFLKGRVHFVGAATGAPFPSAIVVFGGAPRGMRAWDWKKESPNGKP